MEWHCFRGDLDARTTGFSNPGFSIRFTAMRRGWNCPQGNAGKKKWFGDTRRKVDRRALIYATNDGCHNVRKALPATAPVGNQRVDPLMISADSWR